MESSAQQTIISEARHGSQAAFRQLVGRYQPMVYGLCLKMLCSEPDAEDATQDCFVRAWLHLDDYDAGQGLFSTWLCTIAVRLCLDRLRKRKPPAADLEALRHFASETDTERRLESSEWLAIVSAMTQELSPKQQLVFSLRVLDDRDAEETEAITGMSADNIKRNLYVARQKIKDQLKRLGYGK